MNRHRIDRLIEARSLEEASAEDAEVAAIWASALREWTDAGVPGLSVAGAFTHVYQAAFRAATAMVRAAGYRSRAALGGHHYVIFYALAALGADELERLADSMQGMRAGRHTALYGDEEELEPGDLEKARTLVSRLLAEVRAALIAARPALAATLKSS
jgi:hypothetical protein